MKMYGPDDLDNRTDSSFFVENWFLAGPPKDPLLSRAQRCVLENTPFAHMGNWQCTFSKFTAAQLEELFHLGIPPYLSTHACIFKALDEDAGLRRWWQSDAVRRLNAKTTAYRLAERYGWKLEDERKALLESTSRNLVANLTDSQSLLMKFNGPMLDHIAGNSSLSELWCKPSTLRQILTKIGLKNHELCKQ